jgi:hypothetical protein
MYSNSVKGPVVRTNRAKVFGILDDGREYEIIPDLIGLSFFGFLKVYLTAMQTGNEKSAFELRERVQRQLGEPIKSLRVQTEEFTLTQGRLLRELSTQTFQFD